MNALQKPYPDVPAVDLFDKPHPKIHMHALYNESPMAALELTFSRSMQHTPYHREDTVFLTQTWMGTDGQTRYGGFSNLKRSDLVGRKYRIEYWDGGVTIFWLDCLFEPYRCQRVPLGTAPDPRGL